MAEVTIAVTGMPGSGKSTISRAIATSINAPIYSMGEVVRREVKKRGLEITVGNVEHVATLLRKELGMAAVAILLLRELEGVEGYVVVDGVRSLDEVHVLLRRGPLCLVAVHASPLVRFKRLISRQRKGDVRDWKDFVLRDVKNLEYGIGNAIAMADYMIVNEGPLEEALNKARDIARRIIDEQGKSCSGGGSSPHGEY